MVEVWCVKELSWTTMKEAGCVEIRCRAAAVCAAALLLASFFRIDHSLPPATHNSQDFVDGASPHIWTVKVSGHLLLAHNAA